MTQDNVEIVRALFHQWNTDEWRDHISEDVVWDSSESSFLGAGVYTGHDGVVEFFAMWLGAWQHPTVELREAEGAGDRVYTAFRWRGRGRTSGVEVERDFFGVYELRDGLVTRYRQLDTREEARAAAGLPER